MTSVGDIEVVQAREAALNRRAAKRRTTYASDPSRKRGTPMQVLEHIRLVELSGEPSSTLVDRVRHLRNHGIGAVRRASGAPTARTFPVCYADYARVLGWSRGGRGDHLAKAIVLADCPESHLR